MTFSLFPTHVTDELIGLALPNTVFLRMRAQIKIDREFLEKKPILQLKIILLTNFQILRSGLSIDHIHSPFRSHDLLQWLNVEVTVTASAAGQQLMIIVSWLPTGSWFSMKTDQHSWKQNKTR